MNNTRFGTTLLLAIGVAGFGGTMRGAGQYLKIDYPASTASNELQVAVTYTLWIPDGVKTLRGINRASTRRRHYGVHRRLDRRVRLALAGTGEEMGLRALGFQLSRAE